MWTSQKEMKAMMETGREKREAIPKEVEALAEGQEVPNGVTCKETIGATEDRSRDQHLAVRRQTVDPPCHSCTV
jgi:hypothetical protein